MTTGTRRAAPLEADRAQEQTAQPMAVTDHEQVASRAASSALAGVLNRDRRNIDGHGLAATSSTTSVRSC